MTREYQDGVETCECGEPIFRLCFGTVICRECDGLEVERREEQKAA